MDDKLLRKVHRQLRAIKLMLGFFSLIVIVMVLLLGYLAYKVVTFTHNIDNKVTNIQNTTSQKLDVEKNLCNNSSISNYLANTCK